MQFNLVNDQEHVAQFVWRGATWRGVALHGISRELKHAAFLSHGRQPEVCYFRI